MTVNIKAVLIYDNVTKCLCVDVAQQQLIPLKYYNKNECILILTDYINQTSFKSMLIYFHIVDKSMENNGRCIGRRKMQNS